MGQAHSDGSHFRNVAVREQFAPLQGLWGEEDLACLLGRLKDMTLNFSLDKAKFARLLQLSAAHEDRVAQWFREFAHDRASQAVDGLEFLSAAVLLSSRLGLVRKLHLLFELFDLDRTGCVRRDEFTIFLKATTAGLHRAASGLPPPAPVAELGGVSAEFFGTVGGAALSRPLFFAWATEAHYALHYLSVLSRLGTALFAWGANGRRQLGLEFEPPAQRVPAPLLALEAVRVRSVASHESHCLFLAEEGRVWSCGSGFCGILGHGDVLGGPRPRPVEALAHARITGVAVGVRHSAAVSDKGQVFTWGAADMGQLGHGGPEDREVHEWAQDPKTGGGFAYVARPTVVMSLFGGRVCATQVSCCNFSTAILTDQGRLYSWGNNTDGQCGQGQRCPDHRLVYVDPHMQRTAMQAIMQPRLLELDVPFRTLACGGYHTLAVDRESRVWTWGQGMWGKLGHGDQRSMYEPKLVHSLRYQVCLGVAAGEAHSLGLCALYRLTVTGSSPAAPLSPFSLLGLPLGRADRDVAARSAASPPNSQLRFHAFACARLLRLGLPFRLEEGAPAEPPEGAAAQEAVLLLDRGLWEGEWLRLSTSDFDFRVQLSAAGAAPPARAGLGPLPLLYAAEGRWEDADCAGCLCVFDELAGRGAQEDLGELARAALELARRCQEARGLACLCVLPRGLEALALEAPAERERLRLPLGVLSFDHGAALRKHVLQLLDAQLGAAGGVPEHLRDWRERREDFTGRAYFENGRTGERRRAPPQLRPETEACLLAVREDDFLRRLRAALGLRPRGVIVCQQSWRPDVELAELPEALLEELAVPVVAVTYEAGEELKAVAAGGSEPWVSMELQPYGGVCAWGSGGLGQLGLAGIENCSLLTHTRNALTGEESSFASRPCYVAHLHEHQVTDLACGASHTVAVTQQGEVFAWGAADGLGVPLDKPWSEVPVFVEQLEGLAKATKAFAGHSHSFVLAEMPFPSAV